MRILLLLFLLCLPPGLAAQPAWEQLPPMPVLKEMDIEDLMRIDITVTSVSKHPERLGDTAAAIQVITQEDIRRSGATRLPEALRLAPNLAVNQIDTAQWAVSARGFNNMLANKLLVLIDGRTVYSPLFAGLFWDQQDVLLEDVDRIEVISGPGATVWGANAVNGVINVITKHTKATRGVFLQGGGGTLLRGLGEFRYGGALSPQLHFRVYGKYLDYNSLVFSDGRSAGTDWRTGRGGFRLDWEPSPRDLVTVQGDLYEGRIGFRSESDLRASGGNVLGRWTRTLADDAQFSAQFYFDRATRERPSQFADVLDTYNLDLQHAVRWGARHHVVWGLGYRMITDDIATGPTLALLPPHFAQHTLSGFAQDEIALVKDRLHFTLGMKLEHNEYTGLEFQPSGRLAWRVHPQLTLWSAISRAVRIPSRLDRDLFAPHAPPFVIAGGESFESEELLAYEVGLRGHLRERLSVSVAAFINQYDHLRSLEQADPLLPTPQVLGNGFTATSYGVELAADMTLTNWWRLHAGFTELQLDFRRRPGSTDTTSGRAEASDANHRFFLRSSWDLPWQLSVNARYRYVSRISNMAVPGYSELAVRVAWYPLPSLEIALVGQNLLHGSHPEFGRPSTRQEIPRGIHGTFAWRF